MPVHVRALGHAARRVPWPQRALSTPPRKKAPWRRRIHPPSRRAPLLRYCVAWCAGSLVRACALGSAFAAARVAPSVFFHVSNSCLNQAGLGFFMCRIHFSSRGAGWSPQRGRRGWSACLYQPLAASPYLSQPLQASGSPGLPRLPLPLPASPGLSTCLYLSLPVLDLSQHDEASIPPTRQGHGRGGFWKPWGGRVPKEGLSSSCARFDPFVSGFVFRF